MRITKSYLTHLVEIINALLPENADRKVDLYEAYGKVGVDVKFKDGTVQTLFPLHKKKEVCIFLDGMLQTIQNVLPTFKK